MKELGQNTAAGFLPAEPRVGDIFQRLDLLKNGFEGLKKSPAATHLAEAAEKPEAELKRSYARFYHGTAHAQDMNAILEDLVNQTLRRAHMPYQKGQSLEEYVTYGLTRDGQNAIVIYMLKMMKDGIDLPAAQTGKKKKK